MCTVAGAMGRCPYAGSASSIRCHSLGLAGYEITAQHAITDSPSTAGSCCSRWISHIATAGVSGTASAQPQSFWYCRLPSASTWVVSGSFGSRALPLGVPQWLYVLEFMPGELSTHLKLGQTSSSPRRPPSQYTLWKSGSSRPALIQ